MTNTIIFSKLVSLFLPGRADCPFLLFSHGLCSRCWPDAELLSHLSLLTHLAPCARPSRLASPASTHSHCMARPVCAEKELGCGVELGWRTWTEVTFKKQNKTKADFDKKLLE